LEAAGFDANAKPPEAAATPTPPAATAEAKATTPITPPAPAAAVETTGSEKSAVLNAAGFVTGVNCEGPLPIWLRPLEWMNAPLRNCSPGVRQAMGRAAIVTLVNALLVLTYLAVFHKN
jgi:hypothetical protein